MCVLAPSLGACLNPWLTPRATAMKTFRCHCGNTIHFENTRCLVCNRALGFLPDQKTLAALEPMGNQEWQSLAPAASRRYRMCDNYWYENVCNWMVPASEPRNFCHACRLNRIIPNLSAPRNRELWQRVESAKRRLLFNVYSLGLTVVGRDEDKEHGLAFQFLEDADPSMEFADSIGGAQRVLTGHRNGVITINLAEADDSVRELIRAQMNERYRTLLGHFRHEIGHYFWDRIVRDSPYLDEFRAIFGDERIDYHAALDLHYREGPPQGWEQNWVSAYAASHAWEDWAETWAHFLHMSATLETARDYGVGSTIGRAPADQGFEGVLGEWADLGVVMNALNRSMGLPDAYPFVLSPGVIDKLRFVHKMVGVAARH